MYGTYGTSDVGLEVQRIFFLMKAGLTAFFGPIKKL